MNQIPENLLFRPFSTAEALQNGISRSKLTRLVQSGVLERLSWGIYQVSDDILNGAGLSDGSGYGMGLGSGKGNGDGSGGDNYTSLEEQFIIASLKCGMPSAICLISALEQYNLTDLIPGKTWIMVPDSKRVSDQNIKVLRTRNPHWDIGIIKEKEYWMTNIERTIVDCFIHSKLVGKNTAIEALKRAVNDLRIKPNKIFDMSIKLNAKRIVMPYLEMMI
jgi:predicted transcriptional regulator of viral defense system